MSRILVCQHVPYELLGTLDPLLRRHGFRVKYVNFGREPEATPSLSGVRGMIVLGGSMNVDQIDDHPHLRTEIALIRDAIDRELPVLGICLGAQLMARALGAEVRPHSEREIGWYEVAPTDAGRADPLFEHFDGREQIFQWHGDTFDLPLGAELLVDSPSCRNQAFRFGSHAYGLQFHLEVDEPMIDRWLGVPLLQREMAEREKPLDADDVREETAARIQRSQWLSDRTFRAFLAHFGPRRERSRLPHR